MWGCLALDLEILPVGIRYAKTDLRFLTFSLSIYENCFLLQAGRLEAKKDSAKPNPGTNFFEGFIGKKFEIYLDML